MDKKYDFSGYATRNNIECSDGRTIRKDAFKDCHGKTVPLVWNHLHNEIDNVLGHALLENREDGVYCYGYLNDSPKGKVAREAVKHGDVTNLSIYANKLQQLAGDVLHGEIKEVSLVLAGANKGAFIDSILIHGEESEEEAIIYSGLDIISHADKEEPEMIKDEAKEDSSDEKEETVKDVFDTLTEKQKKVVYAIIGAAINKNQSKKSEEVKHSDNEEEDSDSNGETVKDVFNTLTEKQKKAVYVIVGAAVKNKKSSSSEEDDEDSEEVKHNNDEGEYISMNVFDNNQTENDVYLTHSEIAEIISDGKRLGSLKESFLQHGITNLDYLFPEAKEVNSGAPEWVKREDEWVSIVMNGVHHTPFSRIKSTFADITEEDARAKGYIKGKFKKEEVFRLLKRTTTPQTVYKKQKLDRDDIIDIVDLDVVSWLKTEMRMMLNEELARAYLVGDGRDPSSDDKINELNIRPIWTDEGFFTIKRAVRVTTDMTEDQKYKAFIRAAKSRKGYKGSGSPIFFTTEDVVDGMLNIEDLNGRIIYEDTEKLARAMRVSRIVTVPVMEGLRRTVNGTVLNLVGIIVNLKDYNVGADKGGAVNMFDDFDIDYNAQKYLIETRCSGAMIKPFSAIAIEYVEGADTVIPEDVEYVSIVGHDTPHVAVNAEINRWEPKSNF
ncbi:MAG: hypothetical protein IJJ10_03260 [Bacillus sp. (in: Bacteria)]|nr:hypothetical protein [Bacillus sp. (in: firmicutes)]